MVQRNVERFTPVADDGDDSVGIGAPTPTLTLTSTLTSVQVSNLILYTNWEAAIVGSSASYQAFSIEPDVDWTIDIYDVVGDFVQSQSGSSASGQISWAWDLYDWTGMLRDDWNYDPLFYGEITISPRGQFAAAPATKPTPLKALDYPNKGLWLIAYQDREKRTGPRQDYIGAMNALAGGPALHNVLGVPGTLMLRYGTNETQQARNNTWIDFRGSLGGSDIRNFYYQGHGSPSLIGGDYDSYGPTGNITGAVIAPGNVSKAYLESKWVRDVVTFNKYTGAKYFRFVFLDGCETAAGDWPEAFGMGKTTNNIAFYQNSSRNPKTRPSCFVGWQTLVGGGPVWGTTAGYGNWRTEWMFNWGNNAQSRELWRAFNTARDNSNWILKSVMDSALRLYGYNDLGFLEYNNRNQWNGP